MLHVMIIGRIISNPLSIPAIIRRQWWHPSPRLVEISWKWSCSTGFRAERTCMVSSNLATLQSRWWLQTEVERAMMRHVEKCSLTIAPAFATILLMERNLPPDIWSISHYLKGFIYYPGWFAGISFHQQYLHKFCCDFHPHKQRPKRPPRTPVVCSLSPRWRFQSIQRKAVAWSLKEKKRKTWRQIVTALSEERT